MEKILTGEDREFIKNFIKDEPGLIEILQKSVENFEEKYTPGNGIPPYQNFQSHPGTNQNITGEYKEHIIKKPSHENFPPLPRNQNFQSYRSTKGRHEAHVRILSYIEGRKRLIEILQRLV
jgi:hypothetical protein